MELCSLLFCFQCMMAILACTRTSSESVSSTQIQQFHSSGLAIQNLAQNHNHAECPMWFNYNSATNDCQCFPFWLLKCDGKSASVDPGQILTYNSHKGLISTIRIRHGYLRGYNKTRIVVFDTDYL